MVLNSTRQFSARAPAAALRPRALQAAYAATGARPRLLRQAACANDPLAPAGPRFPSAKAARAPRLRIRCDFRPRPVRRGARDPHRSSGIRARAADRSAEAASREKLPRAAPHSSRPPSVPAPASFGGSAGIGSSTSTISLDIFYALGIGPPDRSLHDDSRHRAIAKRHQNAAARADRPRQSCGDCVRKQRAQRNRQRDFAISGRHVGVV